MALSNVIVLAVGNAPELGIMWPRRDGGSPTAIQTTRYPPSIPVGWAPLALSCADRSRAGRGRTGPGGGVRGSSPHGRERYRAGFGGEFDLLVAAVMICCGGCRADPRGPPRTIPA
jgi:hypothetical protein